MVCGFSAYGSNGKQEPVRENSSRQKTLDTWFQSRAYPIMLLIWLLGSKHSLLASSSQFTQNLKTRAKYWDILHLIRDIIIPLSDLLLMPRDECMGNLMLSISADSDCVRGPRDWGLTNHLRKYQPSKVQHAVQWLHVNFHTVVTSCESLSLKISSSPIMILKQQQQPSQIVLVLCQNKELPWVGSVGVENIAVKIAVPTVGKAPVNSGAAWWTYSCSSRGCCSSVTFVMGFLAALYYFLCECVFLFVTPEMGNKLIPSSLEALWEWRTWGRGFCQNAMSVWHDSSNDMCPMSRKFCSLTCLWKKGLKQSDIFDLAVINCIVAKMLHQPKPNEILSCIIKAKLGVSISLEFMY